MRARASASAGVGSTSAARPVPRAARRIAPTSGTPGPTRRVGRRVRGAVRPAPGGSPPGAPARRTSPRPSGIAFVPLPWREPTAVRPRRARRASRRAPRRRSPATHRPVLRRDARPRWCSPAPLELCPGVLRARRATRPPRRQAPRCELRRLVRPIPRRGSRRVAAWAPLRRPVFRRLARRTRRPARPRRRRAPAGRSGLTATRWLAVRRGHCPMARRPRRRSGGRRRAPDRSLPSVPPRARRPRAPWRRACPAGPWSASPAGCEGGSPARSSRGAARPAAQPCARHVRPHPSLAVARPRREQAAPRGRSPVRTAPSPGLWSRPAPTSARASARPRAPRPDRAAT